MNHSRKVQFLFLALALAVPLAGVQTTFWQLGSFDEFLQGTLTNVSVTQEGELRLAPQSRVVFDPQEALALSLARDPSRNVYIGTGHQGKVFRVDANQKAKLFFKAEEPDIFALAAGPDGALYVGSSPEGKVYRIAADGKSQVFYTPKAKYIWALAFDANGRLYVGTGDKGQILRVDSSGKAETFFESKQTHIMCLTFDRDGNLLAGSDPNGLVYRLNPQGKAFVLYQASLPEIHDLAADSSGNVYAAALGGAGGVGMPEMMLTPPAGPTPAPVATITVTASEEAAKSGSKAQNPPAEAAGAPSFNRPAAQGASGMPFPIPQGRGSLIRIFPNSTAETVWSSNNESIFGLALRNNHVLFSTDSGGRIFDLDPHVDSEKLTLLTETHESLATRLLLAGSDLYVATSNIAKLFLLEAGSTPEGTFESPVKDTKFVSRWGVLAWRAEVPDGASLEFYTRSGNSERPDQTWSDWAGPYRNSNGSAITSPLARYIQWKAVFRASGAASPALDDVTLSYLNQNLPPQIRSLNVSTGGERTTPNAAGTSSGAFGGGSMSTPSASVSFGAPPSTAGAPGKMPVTLSWQAEDPNGDQLIYTLYLKAEDEREWHLLKDKLRQTTFTIEPSTVADGKYVAKLVASDEESNSPETARQAELLSAPFWVDNTPPQVRVTKASEEGDRAVVQFEAEDSISPLRSAETSIDGKEWREALSDDGIVDSRKETFTVRAGKLAAGEHVVMLRAYDTAGNVGVGKAVIRIPGNPAPSQ